MAWRSSGSTNAELISNLFRNNLITSPTVRDAMTHVDRADYCPDKSTAYQDSPQLIGHSATISAPHMHASAVESLLPYLKPHSSAPNRPVRVLDVGSGSGYLTHVFAEVVFGLGGYDGFGEVIGIEHIEELRVLGEGNMRRSVRGRELLDSKKVRFVRGNGRKGLVGDGNEGGGFDAIHVGAGAVRIHEELVEQLRRPGRLFIPVDEEEGMSGDQYIWVVDKDIEGRVTKKREYGVRYVPLCDAPK